MAATARQIYINILIELVKEEAPTLYLEDYLYFYNKAISEYMKGRYEMYETNQQLADDLRCWKKKFVSTSPIIPITSIFMLEGTGSSAKRSFLYRHLLNCIATVTINKPVSKCDQRAFTTEAYKVTRMSSEIKAGMLDNVYLRPEFYRPYFEIIDNSIVVDFGKINTKDIIINRVTVEYLCQPKYVDLTEEQITEEEDTSQVMEFSEDVGEEITKVALKLILERGSNPRLQSNIAVNQAISDVTTGMKGGR